MHGSGPLRESKRESFRTVADALSACREIYGSAGFANAMIVCPRCGVRMLTVRGQLPLHTIVVDAFTRDGLYATKRAEICQ